MTQTTLQRDQVEQLVREALRRRLSSDSVSSVRPASPSPTGGPNPLVVNVSARHVHVTQEDLEALFKLADADGDGGISKEETMKYLKSQGVELDDVALDMMWQLVDLDGNGTVDMEEFKLLRFVIRKLLDGMKMGHALRLLREIIADQQPEPEPEPEPRASS